MSKFQPNDKVICIDATPLPYTPGYSFMDFSFPSGFIRENAIYCVTHVDRSSGLRLAGKPIFIGNIEVQWDGIRFRKLTSEKKKASKSAKQAQPKPKRKIRRVTEEVTA